MVQIIQGNCIEILRKLPERSVQCMVSSPSYYGLRDYGTEIQIWGGDADCSHDWIEYIQPAANEIVHDGGMSGATLSGNSGTRKPKKSDFCALCGAWRGSYGLEPTPEMYVEHTVMIFREAWRVLKDDGTLWLNLGDSYAGSGKGGQSEEKKSKNWLPEYSNKSQTYGLKQKDLIGIPWMVAFALRADGWYLRSEIIWHKPNPMPESVKDRPTKAHEQIFLFSKSQKYFYDYEAVLEPALYDGRKDTKYKGGDKDLSIGVHERWTYKLPPIGGVKHVGKNGNPTYSGNEPDIKLRNGVPARNLRSVWTVTPKPYKGAHFAVFPPDLIEPCILAGTSAKGECPVCGKAWARVVEKERPQKHESEPQTIGSGRGNGGDKSKHSPITPSITTGWAPQCDCGAEPVPQTVLDPFNGSGTSGAVALKHGREYVGLELNPKYIELTHQRFSKVQRTMQIE